MHRKPRPLASNPAVRQPPPAPENGESSSGTAMAMIEFEDRDAASRRALHHYLETGEPEEEHVADVVWAAVGILASCATLLLPILALIRSG
jgi:hypothetical protein